MGTTLDGFEEVIITLDDSGVVIITLDGIGEVLLELDGIVIIMSLGTATIDTGDIATHTVGPLDSI